MKVHTNGVLLSEDFCDLFAAHGVGVGISLDGDKAANDRHRRYRDGRSSYDPWYARSGCWRAIATGTSTRGCCAQSMSPTTR